MRFLTRHAPLVMLSLFLSNSALAINLLSNPSYETATLGNPPGTTVTFTGVGCPPVCDALTSAADKWNVHTNSLNGTVMTTLVTPSTAPPGGGLEMIHVVTSGGFSGLWQSIGPAGTGPDAAIASVWVFLNKGSAIVGLGSGNGGALTTVDTMSLVTTGTWQFLTAPSGHSPVNEFIVYSTSGPGDFFVDLADLEAVTPEPGTLSLMLLGTAVGSFLALRRRRRA